MGRIGIGLIGMLAVGLVAWIAFGGSDPGATDLGYDPLGPMAGNEAAALGAPGLEGREVASLIEPEVETGNAHVSGLVVDERGQPLAGVGIEVRDRPQREPGASWLLEPPLGPGRVVATGVSDALGHFTVGRLVAVRPYYVSAAVEPPRYSDLRAATASLRPAPVRILVGRGTPLAGRVVDGAGKGLSAWVSASASSGGGLPRWLSRAWSHSRLRTGADGTFSLAAVPSGEVRFTVLVTGRGARRNIVVETPSRGEVLLRFEEAGGGATVTGRIADRAGGEVPGARVSATAAPEDAGWSAEMTTRLATSDEAGHYHMDGLPDGEVRSFTVGAEGYVGHHTSTRRPVAKDAPALRIDVMLARGALLAGRVLDEHGAPIVGAELRYTRSGYSGSSARLPPATSSDAEGRYTLNGLPLGVGTLTARAQGYFLPAEEEAAGLPWNRGRTGISIEPTEEGQRLEHDVTMQRGIPIEGRVVDEQGVPVAGSVVTVRSSGNDRWRGFTGRSSSSDSTTSDADGMFLLPGVAPDKTYTLTAGTDTHRSEPMTVSLPQPADAGPVEIAVKTAGIVEGTATLVDGTPVPGMRVTCSDAPAPAYTGADGGFRITGILPGKRTVKAGVRSPRKEAEKSVELEWGQTISGITLVIAPGLTIEGVVVDEQDEPAVGISLRARAASSQGRSRFNVNVQSRKDGTFVFEGVPEGEYELQAGSRRHDGTVAAGTKDVRLVYARKEQVAVEGLVLDAEGQPVAGGQVRIYYGEKRRAGTSANISGGHFRKMLTTDETTVDLHVTSAYDATGLRLNFSHERRKDVDASDGPAELRLGVGLEIRGRVLDDADQPVAGVLVAVGKKGSRNRYYGSQASGRTRTNQEGRFHIVGLDDEEVSVSALPGGGWTTPSSIDTRPGGGELVFRLGRGGSIAGLVVDAGGEPLAGARVSARETKASREARGLGGSADYVARYRFRDTAGADGTFEIVGLPQDGYFDVSASKQAARGEAPYVGDAVKGVATGARDLLFRLRTGVTIEGVVLGPADETVNSGWVHAKPVDPASGLPSASGHLRGSNAFSVGPLQPGRYYLTMQVYDSRFSAPAPFEVDAPAREVRIVLVPAQQMKGRVEGEDVKGFNVQFASGGNATSSSTKQDGTFSMKASATGAGVLFATRRGDSRYGRIENADPASGPYTITLVEGQSIRGRVENYPASQRGGWIYAMADGLWVRAQIQEGGDFEILGVPPGEYDLRGWVQGGQIQSEGKVSAGGTARVKFTAGR